MQSEEIKNKNDDTLKNISTFQIRKKIISISLIVFLSIILLVSIYLFLTIVLQLPLKLSFQKNIEQNPILKKADEAYKNGFLENSALYYQSYLKNNPQSKDRIIAYKRLFEIAILSNNSIEALYYLDKWGETSPNDALVFTNRLKIYLREERLVEAKKIIDTNYNMLKKSVEFRELVGVYFIKTLRFDSALNELNKISPDKREFSVHKKIINCYLKLNQLTNSLAYINKLEPKLRSMESKDTIIEFAILKAVTLILKDDIDSAIIELKIGLLSKKYRPITLKLTVYCNILTDTIKEIDSIMEEYKNELYYDADFLKVVADYFYFKKNYEKSLEIYQRIKELREYKIDDLLTLSDIYFKTGKYTETISIIEKISNENYFSSATLYKNLSICYNRLDDRNNELFYLKEGLNKYSDDIDFYVRLTKFYFDKKEYRTALKYIEDGNKVLKNSYDYRLENLRIMSLYLMKDNLSEQEMLNTREKENSNPEYYFKLIEFYLKDKRYSDAKREIDTVTQLSLSIEQRKILNLYKIIRALGINDDTEYQNAKKELISSGANDIITRIDTAIIYIIDGDFQKADEILSAVDTINLSREIQQKVFYLKAIIFYYNQDFVSSYRFLDKSLEIAPYNKRALYLKSLIQNINEF